MARAALKRPKRLSKVKHAAARNHQKPRVGDESDSLEGRIVAFARSGRLKQAGNAAVESHLKAGLPVVYQAGNRIVREHPDGTRETMRTVDDALQPVPARFRSLVVPKRRR